MKGKRGERDEKVEGNHEMGEERLKKEDCKR